MAETKATAYEPLPTLFTSEGRDGRINLIGKTEAKSPRLQQSP